MSAIWAPFFTEDESRHFEELVRNYFSSQKRTFVLDDGLVSFPDDTNTYGLTNLAQQCHQSLKDDWPQIIQDHFTKIFNANKEGEDIAKLVSDFKSASQYLAVKVYHKEYADEIGLENLIWETDFTDTISILVFDLPSVISSIKPEQTEKWGKSPEELFAVGIENIKYRYNSSWQKEKLKEIEIFTCFTDDNYAATRALYLKSFPDLMGKFGSLVGIPHRHAVLCYPINGKDAIKAVTELIPLIRYMEKEGPGSISSLLYWYNDGKYTNLPYKIENDQINIFPPESFVSIIDKLT